MLRSGRGMRRSRGEFGGLDACASFAFDVDAELLEPGGASLKIWTVSVADETHRRVDVALKLMQ